MSLSDALAAFKEHVQAATQFADSGAHIAAREMEFKQAVADAHAALEERISAIEQHVALSIPPLMSLDPATGAVTQVDPPTQELLPLTPSGSIPMASEDSSESSASPATTAPADAAGSQDSPSAAT